MAFTPFLTDGFDNYESINQRWTVGAPFATPTSTAASRHPWGRGFQVPGHLSGTNYAIEFPPEGVASTVYYEGAWRLTGTTTNIVEMCGFGNTNISNAFRHYGFRLNDTRHVWGGYYSENDHVFNLGPSLGPDKVFEVNVWYWVQIYLKIHRTAGEVIFQVNGSPWLQATGIRTDNQLNINTSMNIFWMTGTFGWPWSCDDFVWQTGAGSFQGDMIVLGKRPFASGSIDQFTKVGAANGWDCVKEITADDDTTRLEDTVIGHESSYKIAKIIEVPDSSIVLGTQLALRHRKTEPGARSVRGFQRTAAGTLDGNERFPSETTYLTSIDPVFVAKPGGGAWGTVGDFNALDVEAGVRTEDGI